MLHLSNSIADWENLLPELLAAIAKLLTSTSDYTSFRGVCKSWRSAATFDNFDHAFPQVPWLVLTKEEDEEEESGKQYVTKFFDLSKNKTFSIANLAKEKTMDYYLSCTGWLVGVAKSSMHLHLMHPIRSIRIELPDLNTFPGYTDSLSNGSMFCIIWKMVLSGSPTITSDLVIMVIWGEKDQLAFSRPGDSTWTLMEFWDGSFTDILYHNEKLYAIDNEHRVVECDIHGPNPTRVQQILSLPGFDQFVDKMRHCYMVESSGKFLIVSVLHNFLNYSMRVFEFDLMDGSHKEINDLGNRTLFLSICSPSLCLEGFAWNKDVTRNGIYFASLSQLQFWYFGETNITLTTRPTVPGIVGFPTWVVPGF